MYQRILVPTDGSDITNKGHRHGGQPGLALGAKIYTLSVRSSSLQRSRDAAGAAAGVLRRAGRIAAKRVNAVREAVLRPGRLTRRTPSRAVHPVGSDHHAKTHACDLIVMSSRSRRASPRCCWAADAEGADAYRDSGAGGALGSARAADNSRRQPVLPPRKPEATPVIAGDPASRARARDDDHLCATVMRRRCLQHRSRASARRPPGRRRSSVDATTNRAIPG